MPFKIQIVQPAIFTTVKVAIGKVAVVMILSSEPGVQASVPGDLELSFLRAFVQGNDQPGKVGCVCQVMIWS